jgi:hypothetical protein
VAVRGEVNESRRGVPKRREMRAQIEAQGSLA